MNFNATKAHVLNRGVTPDSFLQELVLWAKDAPDEIFTPNPHYDIYSSVKPFLGPYTSLLNRKAVMCEVLRVLGGFESSWNWDEGVDTTNQSSLHNINGQETGIFQVSFDSVGFDPSLAECVNRYCGGVSAKLFIPSMKSNHVFAMEYCARLLRFNINWDGPIKRGYMQPWLKRDAVAEFEELIAPNP